MLQTLPNISITGGQPIILLPLIVILLITAAKDFYEDYKRHQADYDENSREVEVYDCRSGKFKNERWKDLKVGDIARVKRDQPIPADMITLHASNKKGSVY